MFPTSSFGASSSSRKGARIALEPYDEWKIHEIGNNGVEYYIRPESFSDHVGKLARQVDWKTVVGSDAVYDNPSLVEEGQDELEEGQEDERPKTEPAAEELVVPDAGPWHGVAKNLHESLQQLNVLLDNLVILQKTNYMEALTILDPLHAETGPQQQQIIAENVTSNKALQWLWKRKALSEATSVLDRTIERLSHGGLDAMEAKEKGQFFMELKKMREYWRIRKTGDHIYGDLGYHIFGSKYNPRELFDISRRSKPGFFYEADLSSVRPTDQVSSSEKIIQSVLQVSVPRDLTRRATISVSMVKDDQTTKNMFASLDDAQFEFMRMDIKKTENIHWDNALKWAQETLICRDTFEALCTEAVQMRSRLSTIRDGVLLVSLYDGWLLRVELKYHPFRDGVLMADGDSYLNRSLRQIMVARECTRWIRPQLFVSLPVSNLSEALDARGPKAFTQHEIESRAFKPEYMLEKLLQVSSHYSLVKMVVETLKEFVLADPDPQVHWRFLRCTPINSQLMIIMTNRNFDYIVGKTTYYMKISHDNVALVSKEGHVIECYRDQKQLLYSLKFMLCSFSLNAVAALARMWWWFQGLHANMNALDAEGNAAPTLYMCNSTSTRHVLLRFGVDRPPIIKIRKFVATPSENPAEDEFTQLNYARIPGSTLCKKMDNLFALLRESEVLGNL